MRRVDALAVLQALGQNSVGEFIIYLISDPALKDHSTLFSLVQQWPELLQYALDSPTLYNSTRTFVSDAFTATLTLEVAQLASRNSGWHFSARNASAEQINAFSIEDMANKMETEAPTVWTLFGQLLASDPVLADRRKQYLDVGLPLATHVQGEPTEERDEEAEYWTEEILGDPVEREEDGDGPRRKKCRRRARERLTSLQRIRRVVIMSIFMVSTNQKCNPLACMLGIFCHSTSAPELVVEVLAHAGLSISLTATHTMINSLSEKALKYIRELAKTKVAAFAYDNFDMDFKSFSPTVEKPGTTLQHATSALIFPLEHGVTPSDLKFVDEIWSTDPMNLAIPSTQWRTPRNWTDCLPPAIDTDDPDQPSLSTRLMAWHFRLDLWPGIFAML
ncbi:hypothetical protein EUX98_g8114 [Antrodiella citrinella]|uniref:Uncharacterized protein n=1 Tax=Antrodiella citrinella TaxID=2447956 RepID=A0A4S4MC58_9APHY|nr:hypothetical protein EUX98_g8114 [Antrodiella citrinella]